MFRFVACKAFPLFKHGTLLFGKNIVEDLLYNVLDMLMIFFFVFTVAVFILDSAFVVFQYSLYVIHIYSIWVFMVEVGSFPVLVCIMPFFCQNSMGVFIQFLSKIDFFHSDNLFSLFGGFNPCLECIGGSFPNGLYGNILI